MNATSKRSESLSHTNNFGENCQNIEHDTYCNDNVLDLKKESKHQTFGTRRTSNSKHGEVDGDQRFK